MNYPSSLASWTTYLDIFPEDLSVILEKMARSISLAIGPLASRPTSSSGAPDGFDGLSRRGSYERLLASEWALADEVEDEFLRRAVMGEHLFLRQARREPSGSRVSLALFDSGPNQIGAPRIAHIAALIALTRRATSAGAQFGWGILQQPEMAVLPGLGPAEVMRLIEARGSSEATDQAVEIWRQRMSGWRDLDDLWVVGGRRLSRLSATRDLSRLFVSEVYEPGSRELTLSVQRSGSPSREVVLELPPEQMCARLLRDPFQIVTAPPVLTKGVTGPLSNLVFSGSGSKLFSRSADGGVVAFPIPNSPAGATGKAKLYTASGGPRVDGVGWIGRTIATVSGSGRTIEVGYVHRRLQAPPPGVYTCYDPQVSFTPTLGGLLRPCFKLQYGRSSRTHLAAVDGIGTLFRLSIDPASIPTAAGTGAGHAFVLATAVLGVAPVHDRLVYVGREWTDGKWSLGSAGAKKTRAPLPFDEEPVGAFFGAGGGLGMPGYGLLAIGQSKTSWWVTTSDGMKPLLCPAGLQVAGVARLPLSQKSRPEPVLIALGRDKRTVSAIGGTAEAVIFVAGSKIEHITASAMMPYLAYSTVEGDVVVYSLTHQTALCRFFGGGSR